jgi:hypothetical protein
VTFFEFVAMVRSMRAQQRAFFRTKDRAAYDQARDLERSVDAAIKGILDPPGLFDDAKGDADA